MGMDFQIVRNYIPLAFKASVMTMNLTVLSVIFGSFLGLLIAVFKLTKQMNLISQKTPLGKTAAELLYAVGTFYTWFFRGTPLLLQLLAIYYGLPQFGIQITSFAAAIFGLTLNAAAYVAEIIRGAILSIDKGQMEASKALGMNERQALLSVILPQSYLRMIPPMGNEFIALLKDSSLVSAIAMVDLMRSAQQVYSSTGSALEPFTVAAVLYLLMTTIFSVVFRLSEKRLSVYV